MGSRAVLGAVTLPSVPHDGEAGLCCNRMRAGGRRVLAGRRPPGTVWCRPPPVVHARGVPTSDTAVRARLTLGGHAAAVPKAPESPGRAHAVSVGLAVRR